MLIWNGSEILIDKVCHSQTRFYYSTIQKLGHSFQSFDCFLFEFVSNPCHSILKAHIYDIWEISKNSQNLIKTDMILAGEWKYNFTNYSTIFVKLKRFISVTLLDTNLKRLTCIQINSLCYLGFARTVLDCFLIPIDVSVKPTI